eukprot:Seg7835.2 transcript_id=Seg7835.2/GoldUCD/mRNA.D3Y31 product="hypothetical protein" protein_id=Seg7835.2/GoldUCD/D3Y31
MTIPCDCDDYELPKNDGNDCDYCGCKPTKHAVVKESTVITSTSTSNRDVGLGSLMSPIKKARNALEFNEDISISLEPSSLEENCGSNDAADEVVRVDSEEESSGPCEGEYMDGRVWEE